MQNAEDKVQNPKTPKIPIKNTIKGNTKIKQKNNKQENVFLFTMT